MSPWRVLFSIEAWSGLMPPAPSISLRFLSSASLYGVSSIESFRNPHHSTTAAKETLLGAQRGERLVAQDVEAREDADGGDERGGEDDARDVFAGEDLPRNLEGIRAHAPCQHDRAERSDQSRERAEDTVLEQQHSRDRPRVRAERLED